MGSNFRQDKIGALSHAGGNISMAPSILTIGGRQFETTSITSVALPSLAANNRYQVFAVNNAGTVELVISQNENSVGPAGWDAWKLVGSLYSNGLSSVGFGAFVNIKGSPETTEWRADDSLNNGLIGFGVTSQAHLTLYRSGGVLKGVFHFKAGTVNASDARFSLENLVPDVNRVLADADVSARKSSYGWAVGGNASGSGPFAPAELQFLLFYNGTYPTSISMTDGFQSSGGDGFPRQVGGDTVLGSNASMQGEFEIPITGWSSVAIEDL